MNVGKVFETAKFLVGAFICGASSIAAAESANTASATIDSAVFTAIMLGTFVLLLIFVREVRKLLQDI